MQSGSLVSSDVQAFVSRVLVNGIQREVLSWSVDREIANDLPAQVVGGSGVSQATGSIAWASRDVEDGSLNPWNPSTGWIPNEGDRVDIYVGDGVTEWKQFTGLIDKTSGSIGGGITSTVIDNIDKLSAVVELPALMTAMPPLAEGGAWRRCGMSSLFTQNAILRKAGFHSVPGPEFGCVLDVPLKSSVWPLLGSVTSCSRRSNTSSAPVGYGSFWGGAVGDYTAEYSPSTSRDISVPLQITFVRATEHNDFGYVRVEYGSSAKSVEVNVNATHAFIRINNVTITSVPCSGDTIVQLLHKNDVITLKTSQGESTTVTSPTGATGGVTKIVAAAGADARVAGFQVSHPTATQHEFASLDFTPTAFVTAGLMHTGTLVLPAIRKVTAKEALEDIGAKTLRPLWIDELGKVQSIASDTLYARPPVQTVTTLDDIRELSWERNLLSVRSEVRTSYQQPTVNARTTPSVEAWSQSGSVVLQSDETQETFIEPPADEDWIMPDVTFDVPGVNGLSNVNKGATSVATGVITDGTNETWATQGSPAPLSISTSQLGPNRFLVKHSTGTLPAGNQVELRMLSEDFSGSTALWPYWRGKEVPRLTANAVVKWSSTERTPVIAGTVGPVLEHDCGPWITSGGDDLSAIDELSSFLADQVTNPRATITGMRVGYDPRRQLGDSIKVSSAGFMGVDLECLIVGVSSSADSQGYEQSLSVRVKSVTSTFTTYEEFVGAWGNASDYSNFLAAWSATQTYADFSNDPLRGTE